MPLFHRAKQPKEVVQNLHESLTILTNPAKNEKERKRAAEEVARSLQTLRSMISDKTAQAGQPNDPDQSSADKTRVNDVISEVSLEIISQNTIPLLINNLEKIDFESSKYVVDLFNYVVHRKVGNRTPAVEYLIQHSDILVLLINGYTKSENAIQYGAMLREAVRHESLAKEILYTADFYKLFNFVQDTAFDVSSDAFATLKDLLTRHKPIVAKYLEENYEAFFKNYQEMILSENYVTKRQALKLLGELLLDRFNFSIMTRYISNVDNLKTIMNVLKSREKQIAFEAFHCFKVFVANPNKPRPIHSILYQNQEKLTEFLTNFQTERADDQQFNDEKQYLIKQIREMKSPPPAPSTASSSTTPTGSTGAGGGTTNLLGGD